MWDVFLNQCKILIDHFVPRKRVFSLAGNHCRKVKYPNNVRKLMLRKKQLYKLRHINLMSFSKYKKIAKDCNTAISNYKLEKESSVLIKPSGKKFFRYANSKLSSKSKIHDLLVNDTVLENDKDKCRALNDQFSSVFTKDDGILPNLADRHINFPVTNFCISRCDVVDAIKCLSVESAPGIDGLPAVFFKKCSRQLSVPLQSIFQKSLSQGKLPSQWKIGKIVPIFKNKGSRSAPVNYRPVSLTNISCKLMERILKKHVNNHLLNNNLLYSGQHGFLSGKSTQTQLLECLNDWTEAIDKKAVCRCCLLGHQQSI